MLGGILQKHGLSHLLSLSLNKIHHSIRWAKPTRIFHDTLQILPLNKSLEKLLARLVRFQFLKKNKENVYLKSDSGGWQKHYKTNMSAGTCNPRARPTHTPILFAVLRAWLYRLKWHDGCVCLCAGRVWPQVGNTGPGNKRELNPSVGRSSQQDLYEFQPHSTHWNRLVTAHRGQGSSPSQSGSLREGRMGGKCPLWTIILGWEQRNEHPVIRDTRGFGEIHPQ